MNVVLHGILPLLTLTAVLVAAVMPVVFASWMRSAMAVAVTLGQRPVLCTRIGVQPVPAGGRRIPTDVLPANQAWRAPPTVRPQRDDPAEGIGRRFD
jgi:hypothetical protein